MRIEYQACPLCGSEFSFEPGPIGDARRHGAYTEEFGFNQLVWKICVKCGHEFTSKYWDEEGLKILFRKTIEEQLPAHKQDIRKVMQARVWAARSIERMNITYGKTWLDIGAGSGILMMTAKEYGFQVHGTELRFDTLQGLMEMGLSVSVEIPEERYQTISACDVLEHIPFPKEALAKWRTHAWTSSLLLLSCPNKDAPLWDLFPVNPYHFELEHHHNFGYKRLSSLLQETGWKVLKYGISERYVCCMEIIAEAV